MTKESIILYTKLVGKAKLRLGLGNLKLPKYHYGAFEGIYKEYIDDEIRGNKKRYSVK